jgi:hypothetical protein
MPCPAMATRSGTQRAPCSGARCDGGQAASVHDKLFHVPSRSPSQSAVLGLLLQMALDFAHAELDVMVGALVAAPALPVEVDEVLRHGEERSSLVNSEGSGGLWGVLTAPSLLERDPVSLRKLPHRPYATGGLSIALVD